MRPRGGIATAGALGNTVEVFAGGGRLLSVVPVRGRPVRVAFSREGAVIVTALSALSAHGAVVVVGTDSEVCTVSVGGMPDGLLFDAVGTLWVSGLTAAHLTAIDVASGRVRGVFAVPGGSVRSTGDMLSLNHQGPLSGLLCTIVRH